MQKHELYRQVSGTGEWRGVIHTVSYRETDIDIFAVAEFTGATFRWEPKDALLELPTLRVTVESAAEDEDGEPDDMLTIAEYVIAGEFKYVTGDRVGFIGNLISVTYNDGTAWSDRKVHYLDNPLVRVNMGRAE